MRLSVILAVIICIFHGVEGECKFDCPCAGKTFMGENKNITIAEDGEIGKIFPECECVRRQDEILILKCGAKYRCVHFLEITEDCSSFWLIDHVDNQAAVQDPSETCTHCNKGIRDSDYYSTTTQGEAPQKPSCSDPKACGDEQPGEDPAVSICDKVWFPNCTTTAEPTTETTTPSTTTETTTPTPTTETTTPTPTTETTTPTPTTETTTPPPTMTTQGARPKRCKRKRR